LRPERGSCLLLPAGARAIPEVGIDTPLVDKLSTIKTVEEYAGAEGDSRY
jgi:hypothetical protein